MSHKSELEYRQAQQTRRDRWRALSIGIFLTALLAFGLRYGEQTITPVSTLLTANFVPDLTKYYTSEQVRTGAIVFVPPHGEQCQKNLIDNATWRIRYFGMVNCDQALQAEQPSPRSMGAARFEAIRDGFRR
jgi:hypothetical protein